MQVLFKVLLLTVIVGWIAYAGVALALAPTVEFKWLLMFALTITAYGGFAWWQMMRLFASRNRKISPTPVGETVSTEMHKPGQSKLTTKGFDGA